MRKGLAALGIGAVATAGLLWVILNAGPGTPPADQPVALIGDHAPVLSQAVGLPGPGGTGTVTVAAVREWTQARYLQGLGEVCGDSCEGDAWLVRVIAPYPFDTRKTVFIRLSAFGDGNDWPPVPSCLRAVLVNEMSTLGAPDVPECAQALGSAQRRWQLPFGMGLL